MSAEDSKRLTAERVAKRCEETDVARRGGDASIDADLFLGLGQDRFDHALTLCVETNDPLHNMLAPDLTGAAGFAVLEGKLKKLLKDRNLPDARDVCYFYNFEDPHRPVFETFKKGMGKQFKQRIARILAELKSVVPHELCGALVEELRKDARAAQEQWMADIELIAKALARSHGFFSAGSLTEFQFVPLESLMNEIRGEGPVDHTTSKTTSNEVLQ